MPLIHRGVVTSLGKMNKTVTVTVPVKKFMKKHKFEITQTKKYLAHDEKHLTHLNDKVTIIHTDPKYSPRKAFRIYEIHRKGKSPADYARPDPAWRHLMESRAAEGAVVRQRLAVSAKAEQRARQLSEPGQDFLGDLVDVGRPPRRITGATEDIRESDEVYEDEVEEHQDEEVVSEEELDSEIEEYERSEGGKRDSEEADRTQELEPTNAQEEPPIDGPSERTTDSEGGERR